ncbi:MAG: sigma 54-interacting transcriptional regulator [Deltaproteobacteria bacterium]|nr:sigma 54-interacting transcriptional regulator [Deltaproteobacteria bacterium]
MASCRAELAELQARLAEVMPDQERALLEREIGTLHLRIGEHEQALIYLTASRRSFEKLDDKRRVGQCDALIGTSCFAKGEHERAAMYLRRSMEMALSQGDMDQAARVEVQVADIFARQGLKAQAHAAWERARPHFEKYWDGGELSRIYSGIALLHADLGEHAEASRLAEKALEEAEAAGDPLWLGRTLLARAKVQKQQGDLRGAKRFFRRAISVLQDSGLQRDLAEAYLCYGLFVGEATDTLPDGFTEQPAFWLAKAQGIFRELGGISDLERVRDAFRRYGRRATDRVAEVEVLQLLQDLKLLRLEISRGSQAIADLSLSTLDQLGAQAPKDLATIVDGARNEISRAERALSRGIDHMAQAEEKFLGALNIVVLERDNIRTLMELCRSLNAVQDYARLPLDIAKMAGQLTGGDRAVVALIGEDGKPRVKGAVRVSEDEEGWWRSALMDSLARRAVTPTLITTPLPPTDHDPPVRAQSTRELEISAKHEQLRLGHAMVCPLVRGGEVFGAIYCDKFLCGGVFTERDLDLLAIFAAQVSTILENGRAAEEVRLAARTRAATLEAISDGVLSLSASGKVTAINQVAARILSVTGGDADALRLASFSELFFLASAMARGEELDSRVVRLTTGDYLLNARCIRADGGQIVGMVVTLTEMKRATSLAQKIVGSPARFTFGDIIGGSPSLRRRLKLAEAAARSDSNVLITGESGTGKELLAQAIHNAGMRASAPFVGINCAAIPRELLESELFGYEAGAFTGAKKGGHPGKFELAEGGTILLDEIGDMPLEMQAKLLRVLQERRVQRLGGHREITLDTRVIATTNRDLADEVERGRFRQDLLFRLRVIHVELPPLRERREDIPQLIEHFLELFSVRLGKKVSGVSPEIMDVLCDYPWPGNIRELEHVLEGEVNLASPGQELLTEIPVMIESDARRRAARMAEVGDASGLGRSPKPGNGAHAPPPATSPPVMSIEENEKHLLVQALAAHRGSVPDVARALGVSRGTVYNKMKKFGIDPTSYRGP